jgi:hypothetical protein
VSGRMCQIVVGKSLLMLAEFMFTFMKLNKVNPDLSLSATRVKIIEYQDDGEESEFVEGEEQNEEEANE